MNLLRLDRTLLILCSVFICRYALGGGLDSLKDVGRDSSKRRAHPVVQNVTTEPPNAGLKLIDMNVGAIQKCFLRVKYPEIAFTDQGVDVVIEVTKGHKTATVSVEPTQPAAVSNCISSNASLIARKTSNLLSVPKVRIFYEVRSQIPGTGGPE